MTLRGDWTDGEVLYAADLNDTLIFSGNKYGFGDGGDSSRTVSVDTDDGLIYKNYTDLTVSSTKTLTVASGSIILCTGTLTLDGDISVTGVAGGAGGLCPSSAGPGNGGAGGTSGGYIFIAAKNIVGAGNIYANGGNGGDGEAGGSAGGDGGPGTSGGSSTLIISHILNPTITTQGGNGGSTGGTGGTAGTKYSINNDVFNLTSVFITPTLIKSLGGGGGGGGCNAVAGNVAGGGGGAGGSLGDIGGSGSAGANGTGAYRGGGGAGGGGAGGFIFIISENIDSDIVLYANGGNGGSGGAASGGGGAGGRGGGGSGGVILTLANIDTFTSNVDKGTAGTSGNGTAEDGVDGSIINIIY
jgi:hypothetical protein